MVVLTDGTNSWETVRNAGLAVALLELWSSPALFGRDLYNLWSFEAIWQVLRDIEIKDLFNEIRKQPYGLIVSIQNMRYFKKCFCSCVSIKWKSMGGNVVTNSAEESHTGVKNDMRGDLAAVFHQAPYKDQNLLDNLGLVKLKFTFELKVTSSRRQRNGAPEGYTVVKL